MARVRSEELLKRLSPERDGEALYAVLDGARDPRIHSALMGSDVDHRCLYLGHLAPRLARAAPWLVQLGRTARFSREVLEQGWGQSWGIFLHSAAPMEAVYRHLRRFLKVRSEAGANLVFRYYDPRVLRVFLPTCDAAQIEVLYGTTVSAYLFEDAEGANVLSYRHTGDGIEAGRAAAAGPAHWLTRYLKDVRERDAANTAE